MCAVKFLRVSNSSVKGGKVTGWLEDLVLMLFLFCCGDPGCRHCDGIGWTGFATVPLLVRFSVLFAQSKDNRSNRVSTPGRAD